MADYYAGVWNRTQDIATELMSRTAMLSPNTSGNGIGVGDVHACGTCDKKKGRLPLERA